MEALWVAKTGLDAQQTRMTVVSNNLANVNTSGFKKSRAVFEDLLYQNVSQVGGATSQDTEQPTGLNLGTGVRVVATEKSFSQGTTVNTGNPFDVMISGRGWARAGPCGRGLRGGGLPCRRPGAALGGRLLGLRQPPGRGLLQRDRLDAPDLLEPVVVADAGLHDVRDRGAAVDDDPFAVLLAFGTQHLQPA